VRSLARGIILALTFFLSANGAFAQDYSVEFGADTERGKDAGKLDCRFGHECHTKLESLGFSVSVKISREPGFADVSMQGDDRACCYFENGRNATVIDVRKPVSRVQIFKGIGSRGNLFIQNEHVGFLYLRFHFDRVRPSSRTEPGNTL
jgi:hypothetical protein